MTLLSWAKRRAGTMDRKKMRSRVAAEPSFHILIIMYLAFRVGIYFNADAKEMPQKNSSDREEISGGQIRCRAGTALS